MKDKDKKTTLPVESERAKKARLEAEAWLKSNSKKVRKSETGADDGDE